MTDIIFSVVINIIILCVLYMVDDKAKRAQNECSSIRSVIKYMFFTTYGILLSFSVVMILKIDALFTVILILRIARLAIPVYLTCKRS